MDARFRCAHLVRAQPDPAGSSWAAVALIFVAHAVTFFLPGLLAKVLLAAALLEPSRLEKMGPHSPWMACAQVRG